MRLKIGHRVWLARARAAAWLVAGVVAWLTGGADSVALVWLASVYANIMSDLSVGAAADDRAVLEAIAALRAEVTHGQSA